MIDIFRRYGEERYSARIAHAIDKRRRINKITSTTALADIISKAHPYWSPKRHPATKVFQAIRIHINQELSALKECLTQSIEILVPGGRLAVITFHSLEARLLKQFVQSQRGKLEDFKFLPIPDAKQTPKVKWINSGIKPSAQEVNSNPRARSALLRVIEKVGAV
jgi:16S rRNA (cytosine1402-N4)-methyltransferase